MLHSGSFFYLMRYYRLIVGLAYSRMRKTQAKPKVANIGIFKKHLLKDPINFMLLILVSSNSSCTGFRLFTISGILTPYNFPINANKSFL
jgi:hypothetical protein